MFPYMGEQFREQTGAGIAQELDLARLALAETREGILVHRPDGTIALFNGAVAASLGFTAEEFTRLPPWGWSPAPPGEREKILELIRRPEGHVFQSEKTLPDGTHRVMEVHSRVADTPMGELVVSVSYDVTGRVRAERMLRDLAFHDPLTGLANRTAFDERLASALASALRHDDNVGLIYIDVDDFKAINDAHGHHIGDAVLIALAHRIEGAVRAEDVVARLGGDEFVIILPRLNNIEDADTVAEKIEQAIAKELKVAGGIGFGLHCAVGVTIFDRARDDARTFVARADLAMYESKKRGRRVPR